MKTLTIQLEDETYRKARILADREGTTVGAMIREYLVGLANQEDCHRQRVLALDQLYRIAAERGKPRRRTLKPLTRAEAHGECQPSR